jgi:hypothetical protein
LAHAAGLSREGVIEQPPKPSREERLAAKLRENLRRRKAQTREREGRGPSLPKEREDS